jgi:hypothetical protein
MFVSRRRCSDGQVQSQRANGLQPRLMSPVKADRSPAHQE